ncbi:hypothetical protein IT157_00035 [bacterium]|nr:hypothetical protein [bacterium]
MKKPGSVMHDFYEAWWPVEMSLDELPLAIRQVRYHAGSMGYPFDVEWKKWEYTVQDRICYQVQLFTAPDLPKEFFLAYGIRQHVLIILGWSVGHTPIGRKMSP